MKIAMATQRCWYEDIKSEVKCENEFFYNDEIFGECVEFDANEEEFERVSKEKGWM